MTITELKAKMADFEKMINTADEAMAEKMISPTASFYTPASPTPLIGGKGYLSFVYSMRSGFSDIQWHAKELIAENDRVAVLWECTGTNDGDFMGVPATGNKLNTTIMNFYYFNEAGQIINDVAAEGMVGILKAIGVIR